MSRFLQIQWLSIATATGIVVLACTLTQANAQSSGDTKAPIMLGWAERARIFPGNLPMQAKLDTGANTSSLNVEEYELVKHDGKTWARITAVNRANARRHYELEVVRFSKTKDHGGPLRHRPVVKLTICIANIRADAELNLSRRGKFIYKLLLGRRFLANKITVDPSKKFTTKPQCR
ncbi:MAG TPA: RimK/LysX family protein [Alphaproteobacteria bacterium]|nr:RimK/LysX family protein [Alphaproteobacteria bacterium]